MLDRIKNMDWLSPRFVTVMQCLILDGEKQYYAGTVKLGKGSFEVVENSRRFATLSELHAHVKPKHPVYLGVAGAGILIKATSSVDEEPQHLVADMIPNLDESLFNWELVAGVWGSFLSVAKQTLINEVLGEVGEQGYRVIGCSLGPFSSHTLLSSIGQEYLVIGETQLTIRDGAIEKFERIVDEQSWAMLDGNEVHQELLPVVGKLIHDRFVPGSIHDNLSEMLETSRVEERQKVLFERGGLVAVLVLLLSLAGNQFYAGVLADRHSALTNELSLYQAQPQELGSLREELNAKTALISTMGLLGGEAISNLCDRLAGSVPEQITLVDVWVNPMGGKIKKDEAVVFLPGTVTVTGRAPDPATVNRWSILLQLEDWVEEVQLVGYEMDEGVGSFSLTLVLA